MIISLSAVGHTSLDLLSFFVTNNTTPIYIVVERRCVYLPSPPLIEYNALPIYNFPNLRFPFIP